MPSSILIKAELTESTGLNLTHRNGTTSKPSLLHADAASNERVGLTPRLLLLTTDEAKCRTEKQSIFDCQCLA